jgi:hypothetical protein
MNGKINKSLKNIREANSNMLRRLGYTVFVNVHRNMAPVYTVRVLIYERLGRKPAKYRMCEEKILELYMCQSICTAESC